MAKGKGFGLLDICIPIYGEWSLAEKCIASIPAACDGLTEDYRVIVLDNGTPEWRDEDGSTLSPKEQSEGVRELLDRRDKFIRLDENTGYPGGVNAAVAKGQNPLVMVLTADVEMVPGSITKMVKDMDNSEIGAVGPKLLFPDGSPHGPAEKIQHAGIAFNIKGDPFHIFIGWSADHPKANKREFVGAVTGAAFMTRRSLWNHIGGMAEIYGVGTFEDMEYCFALRQMGKRILYNPAAVGYHWVGGSIRQGANQGFNLSMNRTMFRGRWAGNLAWDEWERW